MKTQTRNIFIIGVLLIGLGIGGCKENDDLYMYEDDSPAVYFWDGSIVDSTAYTFAVASIDQYIDTVYIPVRIMGFAADRDRIINIAVSDSSTAIRGEHFEIGRTVVGAGKYADSVEVYVYRTEDMVEKSYTIYLQIKESEDFIPGYEDYQTYAISVTDQVLPPSWSYTLISNFGAYSVVKFRFMVSVLQVSTFDGVLPSEYAAMASRVKLALAEYEAEYGPLYDENGERVTFP